jgi:very-short-patch-repair endonuclease
VVDLFLPFYLYQINNLFNRKSLKSFRSSLRKRDTTVEAALWEVLKSKNLEGRKFRRQYRIASYIVDLSINHPGW